MKFTAFRNHSALAVPYLTAFARLDVNQKRGDKAAVLTHYHYSQFLSFRRLSRGDSGIVHKNDKMSIRNPALGPTMFTTDLRSIFQPRDHLIIVTHREEKWDALLLEDPIDFVPSCSSLADQVSILLLKRS